MDNKSMINTIMSEKHINPLLLTLILQEDLTLYVRRALKNIIVRMHSDKSMFNSYIQHTRNVCSTLRNKSSSNIILENK